MKYMQSGGFSGNPFMRLTLGLTLVLLTGFTVSNFVLYFQRMDLSPESVVAYYNGDEEEFRPARSPQSMMEVTHGHLAIMALVMLLLTHLAIFLPISNSSKILLIVSAFASALFSEGAAWLVRFVDPLFAWLKIASFLFLQASLLILLSSLAVFLWKSRGRESKENGIASESEEAGVS